MNRILTLLIALILVPAVTLAGASEQTAMDKLLKDYEINQRTIEPQDQASEIRRLKSRLIDVRVERDRLTEQVAFLQAQIDNMLESEEHAELHANCLDVECIPITEVEEEKILTHIIYTLSQFRLAELIISIVPEENVEAHNKAQKIMEGAKNDLDVLGFDTSDMDDYPTLDELMEQWTVSQGSRAAQ